MTTCDVWRDDRGRIHHRDRFGSETEWSADDAALLHRSLGDLLALNSQASRVIVQIASTDGTIDALDNAGIVWRYSFTMGQSDWFSLPALPQPTRSSGALSPSAYRHIAAGERAAAGLSKGRDQPASPADLVRKIVE